MDARPSVLLRILLPCAFLLLPALTAARESAPADPEPTPRLAAIEIEGNTRTDTALILREMGLAIGQPFAFDDMDAVWDHLEDAGYFAFVDMEYDEAEPGAVTLRVTVEEDMTLEYGPLVRFDRRHKYLVGGRLKEHNFRGEGEVIEAAVSFAYVQRAELSWRRPWFLGVGGLDLKIAGAWENAKFVFRPTDYRKWDAGLELRWAFAGPAYLLGGAGVGAFDQRDDFAWPLPWRGAGSPTGTSVFAAGSSSHTTLTMGVGLDSRDNPFYPRRGLYGEVRGRRWLGSDFANYNEAVGDARAYLPSPVGKHVLAARAWGRRTDGPAQLDNVLHHGGPETVRGYRFGSLEGDEGWLLSVEYRMPLFIMPISPKGEMVGMGLHLFADAGDAWYEGAEAHGPSRSWGGGAHLNIDTLQLRFEAARTDDGAWVFEFMDRFNF